MIKEKGPVATNHENPGILGWISVTKLFNDFPSDLINSLSPRMPLLVFLYTFTKMYTKLFTYIVKVYKIVYKNIQLMFTKMYTKMSYDDYFCIQKCIRIQKGKGGVFVE
ncbi:MAG: hypothetical protein ACOC5T_09610 [Elusimicrobiota bacterium]